MKCLECGETTDGLDLAICPYCGAFFDEQKRPDAELERLIIFSILMEQHEGILGKAPDYIREKWLAVTRLSKPVMLLDPLNKVKFNGWINRWLKGRPKDEQG